MMEHLSAPYRRGLTLGLTMAEIFILILFLLLLVLLALYAINDETKQKLSNTKTKLEKTQTDLEEMTTRFEKTRSQLPKDIRTLVREVESLEKELSDAEKENTISAELLAESEKQSAQYRDALQDIKQEHEKMKHENESLKRNLENAGKMAKRVGTGSYDKGVDPPCWYKAVTRKGKRHEKTYYLLDIAVHDNHLLVRVNEDIPPPGKAIYENGQTALTSYKQEYATLPLAQLTTTRKMSLEEFERIAKPIKDMGKKQRIRKEYACVFYAKIYDATSETAKKRWKQAQERIENFFYPFRTHNDPW